MARYSRAIVLRNLQIAFVALAVGLRLLGGAGASASYLCIAMYAMFGIGQIVHAMMLCWFFTYLTPAYFDSAQLATLMRYFVFGACTLSILSRNYTTVISMRISWMVLACVLVGGFLISHSLLLSEVPDVSVLKSISFLTVAATLIGTWSTMQAHQRRRVEKEIFYGLLALIAFSTPLMFTPNGYLKNGRGFQGLLSHPQAYGPTAAFATAWLIGKIVAARKSPSWSTLSMLVMCLVHMVASQARVAAVALVLGVSGGLFAFRASDPLSTLLPAIRSGRVQLLAFIAFAGVLLGGPFVYERAMGFAAKADAGSNVSAWEAMDSSRGELVRNMLDNIETKFWTGIGFGVASRSDYVTVERDNSYGVPVSATVEKGVMPIAVLEEVGPVGAVWIFGWFSLLFSRARASVEGLIVFLTCFASNLGESSFFSVGGMGLLTFVLVAWSTTQPAAHRSPLGVRGQRSVVPHSAGSLPGVSTGAAGNRS